MALVNNNEDFLDERSFQELYMTTKHGISHVLQVGLKDLFTKKSAYDHVSRVIFVVPGNPGCILFYRHFMQLLYQKTGLPVIGASHIGHVRQGVTGVRTATVHLQVDHKVNLMEKFIPEDVEIVLVGHSIGAFMSTQIMKVVRNRRQFIHSFLLMPALERLADTTGWRSLRVVLAFRWLIYMLVFILSLLRDDLLVDLVGFVEPKVRSKSTPECCREALVSSADFSVIRNILNLARDEGRQVTFRDDSFFEANINRLSFIYCHGDRWSPLEYFRELKKSHPLGDYNILDTVTHDFVMDVRMTEEVVDSIINTLNLIDRRIRHPALPEATMVQKESETVD